NRGLDCPLCEPSGGSRRRSNLGKAPPLHSRSIPPNKTGSVRLTTRASGGEVAVGGGRIAPCRSHGHNEPQPRTTGFGEKENTHVWPGEKATSSLTSPTA